MVYRRNWKAFAQRLAKHGLELSCYTPGREKRCQVVYRVKGAGITNLSQFLNTSEMEEWINGYETCKFGDDVKKIEMANRLAREQSKRHG